MALHAIARLEELQEGKARSFEAAGRSILVLRWKGEVFALRNICPHQSQAFDEGYARAWVYGQPTACPAAGAAPGGVGEGSWGFVVDSDVPVIQCPWHRWEFRFEDGRCATDPHFRVRAYRTEVDEDGTVYVDTAR
jgi:nitrite reductase (NADH) small subunit